VYLSDGKERGTEETLAALAQEFKLTDEELRRLLPSGRQPLFSNRVAWAKFYLKKAGVLDRPRRGIYRITERGRALLQSATNRIDSQVLQQFPEFREFLRLGRAEGGVNENDGRNLVDSRPTASPLLPLAQPQLTPEELIAAGHNQLMAQLSADLLERIKSESSDFFERLVIEVLIALGYGGSLADAGQVRGKAGDEGIDGVIKEDRLGLDTIYVQAKKWKDATVGRPEIQKFAGALTGQRARKGIFITTAKFSDEAHDYVSNIDIKIVLIDGEQLTRLMIERDVGVTPVASYQIKRIDSDYFSED
jgi:restriction system protein